MKRAIFFLLLGATLACAQTAPKALTNDDIIKMVQGGLAESTIIALIQASPSNFDASPDGILQLNSKGVSAGIMNALITAESSRRSAGATTPAASPAPAATVQGQPAVRILSGASGKPEIQIPLEKTQLAQTKSKATSLNAMAGESAMNQTMQNGINTVTSQATSRAGTFGSIAGGPTGLTSSTQIDAGPASFAVSLAGVPGVNPEEYEPAIIKLTPTTAGSWRLAGATQGKEGAGTSAAMDWPVYSGFIEDRVALKATRTGPGLFQIAAAAALIPGDYAVVLRPVSKEKRFSGVDIARNQGDGTMFNSIWTFAVK